jgi:hypothetical protein
VLGRLAGGFFLGGSSGSGFRDRSLGAGNGGCFVGFPFRHISGSFPVRRSIAQYGKSCKAEDLYHRVRRKMLTDFIVSFLWSAG